MAALTPGPALSWDSLARLLLEPRNLVAAIGSLNRFQLALLELACLTGGSLDAARAAREGVEPADFATGGRDLEEIGLAFRDGDGTVEVLRQVVNLVPNPGRLGPAAGPLLGLQTVDQLNSLADRIGLVRSLTPGPKQELVDAVRDRLCEPGLVAALLENAPRAAAAAFTELRRAGGSAELNAVAAHAHDFSWRWRPEVASDGPWWLAARGLILATDQARMRLAIPAEVELALRGRPFPDWSAVEPKLRLRPLRERRHPLDLVAAMRGLLQAWRLEPPVAIQAGGPGKRDVKRAAQALRVEEADAEALVRLGFEMGVLAELELVPEKKSRARRNPRVLQPRQAVVAVTAEGAAWEELAEPERWVAIAGAGLAEFEPAQVAAFLGVLAALPAGQGASAADLGRLLAWRRPRLVGSERVGTALGLELGEQLEWLGAGGGEPAIGLGAAGRAVFTSPEPDLGRLRAALPDQTAQCTVTADHRVIVAGRPSLELELALGRVADVESVQPARVYRLTEASLRRAFDGGLGWSALLEELGRHAPAGIPANVATHIEDLGRRHGRLRIGRAGLYLRTDDEAGLQEVLASAGLRSLGARVVAPTVAVLATDDLEAVLGQLRKAGQMPVVEGAGAPAAAGPATARRVAARAGRPPPAPPDLAAIAAALRAGPAPGAGPAPRAGSGASLEQKLAAAVRSRQVVEVGYQANPGRAPEVLQLIPIRFDEGWVQGIDPQREGVYMLEIRGILWVDEVGPGWPGFGGAGEPDSGTLIQLPPRRG